MITREASPRCELKILDTAGADEYLNLRDNWIQISEGFMLVYSISSKGSFTRIQGLYDRIQQIKNLRPHTSSQVPIMLVGNKVDAAQREVSVLEGNEMARMLGCSFVEASAKENENVQKAFNTVVGQLQILCIRKALHDAPSQWHEYVRILEEKVSSSQKEHETTLISPHAMTIGQPHGRNPKLLPFGKRQRSFLNRGCLSLFKFLRLPTLSKEKASSAGHDISQPLKHSCHSVSEYSSEVQKAFNDAGSFLEELAERIRNLERLEMPARVAKYWIDDGDNYAGGEANYSEVRDTSRSLAENFKAGMSSEAKEALRECEKLCKSAAFDFVRHGESGDKIPKMKGEFAKVKKSLVSISKI